jgi:hypothetical protein
MSPLLPAALAAALAVVVAVEVTAPPPPDMALPAPRAISPGHKVVAAAADQTPRLVAAALARPLFNPGRRPAQRAGGAAVSAAGGPVLPRLAGIIIDPAGGVAIFAPAAAGEKPLAVPVGGTLSAWTVVAIAPREVRVRGPEGESTLHVAFDIAAAGGAPGGLLSGIASPALRNHPINLHPMQQHRGNEAE